MPEEIAKKRNELAFKGDEIKARDKKLLFELMNIIYTDGILTGLTVKFWNIYIFTNKKMYKIRIPLFPMSYNRKTGLSLRKSIEMLKNRRYME